MPKVKGDIELPLAESWRARVRGQSGRLAAAMDVNHRSSYQLGPVYRWRPAAEMGLSYSELVYDHATTAGISPRVACRPLSSEPTSSMTACGRSLSY